MFSKPRIRWMTIKHDIQVLKRYMSHPGHFQIAHQDHKNTFQLPSMNLRRSSSTLTPKKQPVPELSATMSKFLLAVKPLLNETEFEEAQKTAKDFIRQGGVGEKLQSLLVERSKVTDNWMSQWWLDKVYLEPRYDLIISCNPASLYPKADYRTVDEQLQFATKYILGFLQYTRMLAAGLPVDKSGKDPICMDQWYKIVGSCRVPGEASDTMKVMNANKLDLSRSNHVTVMYNNRMFKLEVVDPSTGQNLPAHEIYTNLKNLVDSASSERGVGLGIMTAGNRDNWYRVFQQLAKDETNRSNFESIQDSFFVLCLDGEQTDSSVDSRSLASAQMLHGCGKHTPNRWFDKTVQVIIGQDGVWGTNFEHSLGEAGPHIVLNDFVYKYILDYKENFGQLESSGVSKFKELTFTIPEFVQENIMSASLLTNKLIDNLELLVLKFDEFGKNFPKSQKISPDAFVQLAMQLAFYKTHRLLGNAYESGALRQFHLGRTEVIRGCTSDAALFVRAMLSSASQSEKAALLLKAIATHSQLTKSSLSFESFDRHLFGLKQIALQNQIQLPHLYDSVAFKKASHFYISSSQISSQYEGVTCYGPLVEDGYGCAYNIMESQLLFGISALNSCGQTSAKLYSENLRSSLLDCQKLLLKINSKL